MNAHAVILAGGWGRRLWPKSRRRRPKQLLRIGAEVSPLEDLLNTIEPQIPRERTWVVANEKYISSLQRHLPFLGKKNFLVEPLSKNTASAVGLASVMIKRIDPQAVTAVFSSDNIFGAKRHFLKTLKQAVTAAGQKDILVAVGIPPQRPAKEYGYLKIKQKRGQIYFSNKTGRKINLSPFLHKVERFVEKPDIKKAQAYFRSKNYFWNGGIFVWKVSSILGAIKKHLPQLDSGLQRLGQACGRADYDRCLRREYNRFENISLDYGILQKADNLYTIIGKFPWQDIGSWHTLSGFQRDNRGNVVRGLHKGIDTRDSVIFSEDKHFVGTIGLRGLIVVHTPTATLVCRKDKAQDVKKLTELLEKDKGLRKYL